MARWAAGSVAVERDVRAFGAVGDEITDDSAAFAAAVAAVKATLRFLTQVSQVDQVAEASIIVPPGTYLITNPGAFLGDEAMTVKGVGLTFRGSGQGVSNIVFKPATADALATNDYWQTVKFADLGFHAATAGCTFLRSYTTHNAQRYNFVSCRFERWNKVIDLQGDNNNSEFSFVDCHTSLMENSGAFFYIGSTNTSDQFLNYWFYGCSHWSTSAPFIDAARGGHFHIYGLDVSDWGTGLAAPGYLFNLRGVTHALGVCAFSANDVRVEAKSANAALLYSEWPQGTVTMRGVDWSSQTDTYTYGDIISVHYNNTAGALYAFHDSTLAGGVKVRFSINDWQHTHGITFTGCEWLQKTSPSDVVTYDATAAGVNDKAKPPVRFINCRGGSGDVFSTTGAVVWDATIGYRGQLMQNLEPRAVSVRGVYGIPNTADGPIKVRLPVGAIITSLQALSPAGAVAEADGGTWTLATTDGTPVTVTSVTVAGAMSAGFDVSSALTVPFECNTTARATLTLTATNVTQNNAGGLLLVKGYW